VSRPWFKAMFSTILGNRHRVSTLALTAQGIALRQGKTSRLLTPVTDTAMTRQEAVSALQQVAADVPAGKLRLILSNHFVRYAILPWQPGLYSRSDWLALAQHAFKKRYGQATEQWQITVDLHRYGEAVLACATDAALVDDIQQIGSAHGWQLCHMEPLLSAVMRHAPAHKVEWLLLAEPERLLLCERTTGWQAVSVMAPPPGEMLSQTAQMLNRARQQTEASDSPLKNAPQKPRLWVWATHDLREVLNAAALAEACPDWHISDLPKPFVAASARTGLSALSMVSL